MHEPVNVVSLAWKATSLCLERGRIVVSPARFSTLTRLNCVWSTDPEKKEREREKKDQQFDLADESSTQCLQ